MDENRSIAERLYHVRGDVDLATVPGLRADLRRVINVEGVNLRIDCTHLTFISAAGITALLETNEILKSQGRHLFIVNVPPSCWRVFEILGLTDLLDYDRNFAG